MRHISISSQALKGEQINNLRGKDARSGMGKPPENPSTQHALQHTFEALFLEAGFLWSKNGNQYHDAVPA